MRVRCCCNSPRPSTNSAICARAGAARSRSARSAARLSTSCRRRRCACARSRRRSSFRVKIDSSNVLARDLLAGRLDFLLARVPDDLDADQFDCLAARRRGGAAGRAARASPARPRAGRGSPISTACEWVMQPRGTPLRRTMEQPVPRRQPAAAAPLPGDHLADPDDDDDRARPTRSRALSVEVGAFRLRGPRRRRAGDPADGVSASSCSPIASFTRRRRPLSPAARTVYEAIRALAASPR